MKKSVIFLINGLGIERPGSYSIAIDEAMTNLSRIKDASYFTTAVTSSLEYMEAYENFFLGETSKAELKSLKDYLFDKSFDEVETFKQLKETFYSRDDSKLHIFIETIDERIVEQLNQFVNKLVGEDRNKSIYLHLLLTQQVPKEYDKLITTINYMKFHLKENIQVGFVMGKESINMEPTKIELDNMKKALFSCSCERWIETEKKLADLQRTEIRPCEAKIFCTSNDCYIKNNDIIFFFNTRRENYERFIKAIYINGGELFGKYLNLPIASLIKLHSDYDIPSFIENLEYEKSLANVLLRNSKKCLIITDRENINLLNFYANGLNSINNPIICFMEKTDKLYDVGVVQKIINEMEYDLIIFDYKMDTTSTINHLKEDLSKMDIIIGNVYSACENKHSFFITSLYGMKKTLPIADYNQEMVTLDYEFRIPIFFCDFMYPRSKYDLFPGETNDILLSAVKCITNDPKLDSLIREKTLIGGLIKSLIR